MLFFSVSGSSVSSEGSIKLFLNLIQLALESNGIQYHIAISIGLLFSLIA